MRLIDTIIAGAKPKEIIDSVYVVVKSLEAGNSVTVSLYGPSNGVQEFYFCIPWGKVRPICVKSYAIIDDITGSLNYQSSSDVGIIEGLRSMRGILKFGTARVVTKNKAVEWELIRSISNRKA